MSLSASLSECLFDVCPTARLQLRARCCASMSMRLIPALLCRSAPTGGESSILSLSPHPGLAIAAVAGAIYESTRHCPAGAPLVIKFRHGRRAQLRLRPNAAAAAAAAEATEEIRTRRAV